MTPLSEASEPRGVTLSEGLGKRAEVEGSYWVLKMIPQIAKNEVRQRVHQRIRRKLNGTSARPRLSVYRSLNHIYAQLIDDIGGQTVVSANSREGAGKPAAGTKKKTGGNVAVAKQVGKVLAERAKAKGVGKVVFDRGGYLYHGRVKALADAAREAGLQF